MTPDRSSDKNMSHSTIALLEPNQGPALRRSAARSSLRRFPSLNSPRAITTDGLDLVYEALAWRYDGEPDDACAGG